MPNLECAHRSSPRASLLSFQIWHDSRRAPPIDCSSNASHAPRERVQHPVHELGALHAAVAFGELHSFLDHHTRRRLAPEELGGAHAEHGAFDDTEAIETP